MGASGEEFLQFGNGTGGVTDTNDPYTPFVVPYDGYIKRAMIRTQQAAGSTQLRIYRAGDGVDHDQLGTGGYIMGGKVVDMTAADTTFTFPFDTEPDGTFKFNAGDIIAVSIDVSNADTHDDVLCSLVLMYDID